VKSVDSSMHIIADLDSRPSRKTGSSRVGVTTSGVAAQLRRRILEGEFAYEERLPAERNLAEEFGVSRGTIRSVLRTGKPTISRKFPR
jgi:DNA-binding GntR family transcriptional regulator